MVTCFVAYHVHVEGTNSSSSFGTTVHSQPSTGSITSMTKTGNVTDLKHVLFATDLWEGEATLSQCVANLPPQPNISHKFLSEPVLRREYN
jgi:hypothetical protein